MEYPPLSTTNAPSSNTISNCNAKPALTPTTTTPTDSAYTKELLTIKMEINALKEMITTAVEQFKTVITSFKATPQSLPSNIMDTKVKASTKQHHQHQPPIDLAAFIQDLKYEVTTIVTESQALFKQQLLFTSNNQCPPSSVT